MRNPLHTASRPSIRRNAGGFWILVGLGLLTSFSADAETPSNIPPTVAAVSPEKSTNAAYGKLTLDECLRIAMERNRRRPASRFAIAAAEAQHAQAMAGYWPQISAAGAYKRMDESPNFLFPGGSISIPASTLVLPPGVATVTVPAGVLDPNNPVTLPVNVPAQSIQTPATTFNIPPQDVKLMDPNSFMSSLNANWLLYDGGMRRGYREQAKAGIDAAQQEMRRTDLEINDSIRRLYHGSVLARQLHQLGKDTLARMEATLSLTESLYKEGAGRVKKNDFLDNKIMVESLRAMVALLEKNQSMAQAALANTMGLSWRDNIEPAVQEIPFEPYAANLDEMVGTAYEFNPDWAKLEAGIRAAEGAVRTAKSGHHPKLALTGELHRWFNDADAGLSTRENREGWTVGIGMQIPLFEGFLVRNKVREARAREQQLEEQRLLLRDGLGIMIKDMVLGIHAAQKSHQATLDAMNASVENRDLNTRAYQNELVDTEKVIRSQLMEAMMTAQHLKTRYDHMALQSQLTMVIGAEVLKRLQNH